MPLDALLLIIGAALVHAAWNLLSKKARDQPAFLFTATCIAGLVLLPLAVWGLAGSRVPPVGLAAAAASAAIHALYFAALGAAYRQGDLSVVYPVARGSGPVAVALLAGPLFGERLAPFGWAGVTAVVVGLGLVAAAGLVGRRASGGPAAPGVGLGLAVGACIAAYSLVDRRGVAAVSPFLYLSLQLLGAAVLMTPGWLLHAGRRTRLAATLRSRRAAGLALLCACGIIGAYGLVLTAMTRAPVAYVVAGRELAIVFGTVFGTRVLGERVTPLRAAGAGATALGVVLLAFA